MSNDDNLEGIISDLPPIPEMLKTISQYVATRKARRVIVYINEDNLSRELYLLEKIYRFLRGDFDL